MIDFLIIIAFVFICTVFFFGIWYYDSNQKKFYYNFVLQNSVCLRQLEQINQRYKFFPSTNFNQFHNYDNKIYFHSISCKDYLIYQMQYIRKKLFEEINRISYNQMHYQDYIKEVENIKVFGIFNASTEKLKIEKLKEIESYLLKKHTLLPITQFYMTVTLNYTSMSGRILSKKSDIFSVEDIISINNKLKNKNGDFYNDPYIWDAICRVERGKISNKMRFSIYKKDGYRCRKCGVSVRYAQLEIDHIIPIAKGGKSTYNNLQTLCHECNVRKGTDIVRY